MFKSGCILTFGAEGSIIEAPRLQKQRDQYFREVFKVEPKKSLAAVRKTKSLFAIDQLPPAEEGPTGNDKYTPKIEDLVYVPFRLISETVVAAFSWRATDFTKPNVLKRSQALAAGIPAYTDHMQYCDMFVGAVESSAWGAAMTLADGTKVPAGINGLYMIDGAMNEKLARGLLSSPPMIKSSSVTVEFEFEPSHDDFTDEGDFLDNIGRVHADKRMVSRQVTKVIAYHESSILWMGADPFAKMLDPEGKPMGVDKGSVFSESSKYAKDFYNVEKKMFAVHSYGKHTLPLNYEFKEDPKPNNFKKNMEEITLLISQALGLTAGTEITAEHLAQVKVIKADEYTKATGALSKVEPLEKEVEKLKKGEGVTKVTELTTEVNILKQEKSDNEKLVSAGKEIIEKKRTEVERLAKLNKATPAVIELAKTATPEQLDGLLAQYTKNVTEKFEGSCKKCGSNEFEFKSTIATDDTDGKEAVTSDDEFERDFASKW